MHEALDPLCLFVFRHQNSPDAPKLQPRHATLNRAGSMLLMDKWDLALLQLGRGFLSEVENTFKNKPGTYDAFLHLLSSFKAKSIDAPELARKSHELFEGNHELAVRFDQFISQGFLEEAKKRLTSGPTKEDEHILEILGDQNKKKQPVIVDVQELSKEETRETSGCTIDIVVNRGDDCWQVIPTMEKRHVLGQLHVKAG